MCEFASRNRYFETIRCRPFRMFAAKYDLAGALGCKPLQKFASIKIEYTSARPSIGIRSVDHITKRSVTRERRVQRMRKGVPNLAEFKKRYVRRKTGSMETLLKTSLGFM